MSGNRINLRPLAQRIAEARAWRIRNRPFFDALYPETVSPARCEACGQHMPERG